jgi:hypothetical protein
VITFAQQQPGPPAPTPAPDNVLYLRVVEPTAVIASSASGQRGDESVERNCGSSSVMKVWASRKRSFLRQMRIFHFRLEDETLWV